jgi:hypothetical protein
MMIRELKSMFGITRDWGRTTLCLIVDCVLSAIPNHRSMLFAAFALFGNSKWSLLGGLRPALTFVAESRNNLFRALLGSGCKSSS